MENYVTPDAKTENFVNAEVLLERLKSAMKSHKFDENFYTRELFRFFEKLVKDEMQNGLEFEVKPFKPDDVVVAKFGKSVSPAYARTLFDALHTWCRGNRVVMIPRGVVVKAFDRVTAESMIRDIESYLKNKFRI